MTSPCGKGGIGAGASLLGAVGLAEVIDDDVECGEEGVHVEHEPRFLSLRDRVAS